MGRCLGLRLQLLLLLLLRLLLLTMICSIHLHLFDEHAHHLDTRTAVGREVEWRLSVGGTTACRICWTVI